MLRRLTLCLTLIGPSFSGLATAHGAEYGSPQEARAMLHRAIVEMKVDQRVGDQVCGVSVFPRNGRRHAD